MKRKIFNENWKKYLRKWKINISRRFQTMHTEILENFEFNPKHRHTQQHTQPLFKSVKSHSEQDKYTVEINNVSVSKGDRNKKQRD